MVGSGSDTDRIGCLGIKFRENSSSGEERHPDVESNRVCFKLTSENKLTDAAYSGFAGDGDIFYADGSDGGLINLSYKADSRTIVLLSPKTSYSAEIPIRGLDMPWDDIVKALKKQLSDMLVALRR